MYVLSVSRPRTTFVGPGSKEESGVAAAPERSDAGRGGGRGKELGQRGDIPQERVALWWRRRWRRAVEADWRRGGGELGDYQRC
jgi:hypothetical protein